MQINQFGFGLKKKCNSNVENCIKPPEYNQLNQNWFLRPIKHLVA